MLQFRESYHVARNRLDPKKQNGKKKPAKAKAAIAEFDRGQREEENVSFATAIIAKEIQDIKAMVAAEAMKKQFIWTIESVLPAM